MLSLAHWLETAPNNIIACSQQSCYTKSDLIARIAAWRERLPLQAGQHWAVFHSDTFEFSAILFALWQAECVACLPADICPETVTRLSPKVAGFIGEFPDVEGAFTDAASNISGALPCFALRREQAAIEVYTSGSTGAPKPIIKTIAMIEDEIKAVDQLWQLPSDVILMATVPHQHLFGLTFRLFWPLLTQRVFQTHACTFTEDIFRYALEFERYALISTPSHLKRLNDQLDWDSIRGRCQMVISSAAPLAKSDSDFAAKILGVAVHEIYGSSETGAMAWRSQQSTDYWHVLPTLSLSIEQEQAVIRGPYVAPQYEHLNDRIESVTEQTFRLLGRQDRITKVEGKRLSLTKMEQALEQNDWLQTVKVQVLKRKRDEVVVAAELTPFGKQQRIEYGNKWLIKQLKQALATSFEAVLLPRRWRFLTSLPYNAQGKLSMDSLTSLFDNDDVKWPVELRQTSIDQQIQLTFYVPKDLIYFDGHFDKHPILPGITQTHWAQHFGHKHFTISGRFTRLEAIKFQHVILPDSEITLTLEYQAQTNKLSFQYVSDKGVHSSGRICFE